MQFKLFVVALIGACVLQVTFAHPATQDVIQNRGLIDDLINKAKEAINKLTNLIKEKVNEALSTLNKLKDKIKEQVSQAIETVKEQLKSIIAAASESIQQIIDRALELGIDITECVSDNKERFQQIFESLLADEISCVTSELKEGLAIINKSVTIIQDALTSIISLPTKLSECNRSFTCIKDVLVEVAKLQLQLPIEIAKRVAEATEFVAGLQSRLEVCAATQLIKTGLRTGQIIADVTKCALAHGVGFIG